LKKLNISALETMEEIVIIKQASSSINDDIFHIITFPIRKEIINYLGACPLVGLLV